MPAEPLWYPPADMRQVRGIFRFLIALAMCAAMLSGAAFAQSPKPGEFKKPGEPPPAAPPGVCAPWHRCAAYGLIGAGGLYLLFLGAQFMYQKRGFDTIEHRMGSPEGVAAKKE